MIRTLRNTFAGEFLKLCGLPSALAAMVGTVAASIALAAALATSAPATAGALHVMLLTVPFLQIGTILVGVLTVATEYAGSQIRTTLTATPNRPLLLAGKSLTYLTAAAITSAAAVGAGLATAAIDLAARNTTPAEDLNGWPIAGAIVYLTLIGLLGFALTILLRSLIPPLVTMLSLVLIASPLISGYTAHARWLPDKAGSGLYLPAAESLLTAGSGALILLAWIAATGALAFAAFLARDA